MAVMEGCTVKLSNGTQFTSVPVLFKDNGWVRVTARGANQWYPPQKIARITRNIQGEADE